MPKLEKEVQIRFLDNLLDQNKKFESSPISIYQRLVFQRYEEVLRNSFPLFIKEVDEELFENSIKDFMKETPSTPFLWKVPKDYIKFVKRNKLFNKQKYLYELLYFDWIEIEIYMREYKFSKKKKFSYKDTYKLSESARIKKFKYDILNKEYTIRRENFLVIYYDFETNEVIYREINPLIYELLDRLNKKQTIGKILKEICLENEIDFKEAKKLLKEPLVELLLNKVFL
ncbi:putative DNA-binding domain-containing protein [Halarcobacter sp.]|uniref:HvfC/BufC family peptide modification chaperone n=1 Tax=Halarcobacter sp. TaxID=2321133 RepID=UPI002AAAFED1|nr:putative DNA-binding domain-containing protein [Halarcobacter sp.]